MAHRERYSSGGKQQAGGSIGDGDHLFAADGIEEAADGERAEETGDREGQQVPGNLLVADVEEGLSDQAIAEEDRVEEEGLRDHQDETKIAALAILAEHVAEDVAQGVWSRTLIFSGAPSGFGSEPGLLWLTFASISWTASSARCSCPRSISQRGLSGTASRRKKMTIPSRPPMPKA